MLTYSLLRFNNIPLNTKCKNLSNSICSVFFWSYILHLYTSQIPHNNSLFFTFNNTYIYYFLWIPPSCRSELTSAIITLQPDKFPLPVIVVLQASWNILSQILVSKNMFISPFDLKASFFLLDLEFWLDSSLSFFFHLSLSTLHMFLHCILASVVCVGNHSFNCITVTCTYSVIFPWWLSRFYFYL